MSQALGYDFSGVRLHNGVQADRMSRAVGARAFTTGSDIFFRSGEYDPNTAAGKELLAHELTHVVQQSDASARRGLTIGEPDDVCEREADRVARAVARTPGVLAHRSAREHPYGSVAVLHRKSAPSIQRRVSFAVLDWDATRLGPPVPTNGSDPRYITIPDTGQILISGLVQVNGDATDPCDSYEIGTAQTAWIAWTVANYRGRNPGEGSITVRHRAPMPMRDPAPGGDVWFDPLGGRNVRSPGFCGDSVGVFHRDSPWHSIPKARNNGAVAGNPLNYLRSYTRGLHLVAYLTAREPGGGFLPSPLRFVYWNSLQDFTFTPNYANPYDMWAFSGQVRVNIGAKGRGATADAPYYTTSGPHFNDHFNNSSNWDVNERP